MQKKIQNLFAEMFSKRNLSFKKIHGKFIGFLFLPILILAFYMMMSIVVTLTLGRSNSVLGQSIVNAVVIVFGIFCTRVSIVLAERQGKHEEFKPSAWSVFFVICSVILLWVVTQCIAVCVATYFNDTGLATYTDMVSSDMTVYVFSAVFVAPFAEEFIFRGFMYNIWKKCMNPIAAGMLSACFFALIHGTLAHLPVAFLMGFFNAMIYEVTKQIRYPMLCHVLYNFCSVSAIIPVDTTGSGAWLISPVFAVISFIITLGLIVLAYAKKAEIRQFVTSKHMIDYLNRKWDDDGEWYDGKKIDKYEPKNKDE